VRGGGLMTSKELALGTREGSRAIFNSRGDPTRNLLGQGLLIGFLLVFVAGP